MNKKRLIEHHLCFLKQNRGIHQCFKNIETIVSQRREFNISIILDQKFDLEIESEFLYIPDDTNIIPETNYSLVNNITYMTASSEVISSWNENIAITVKKVTTPTDLEVFSEVQVRGFNETDEAYSDWYPWLRTQNVEGFTYENQHYYIAYINEVPVGVCLIVEDKKIYGLYAIATNPKYRKQGVATTIMKKSLEACQLPKDSILALQVLSSSGAERLYKNLGFVKEFSLNMYQKQD
ncbi:putative N-acetyltransferase domain-containing protein [Tenacibaculum sp. 190130A14a]|uniref:N-acetyltransferase domain-containing protein n=1 Tax=Tenacibaculum polynesiense TaxID=3137857 RepID=A0ABM9P6G9_9FLAO